MSDPASEFDDPALKSALRGAMAGESASAGLRDRITGAIDSQTRRRTRRMVLVALGLAMVIISGTAYLLMASNETPAPGWFADAMIVAHNQAKTSGLDRSQLAGTAQSDLPALRQQYRQVLGYPALVAMLDDGWQFKGAGISQIGSVPAAHLIFTKGSDTISIFSVNAAVLYQSSSQKGATYAQERQGYEIAGFIAGGAVHCLVCESPSKDVSLSQVIRLRNRLRKASPDLGS